MDFNYDVALCNRLRERGFTDLEIEAIEAIQNEIVSTVARIIETDGEEVLEYAC